MEPIFILLVVCGALGLLVFMVVADPGRQTASGARNSPWPMPSDQEALEPVKDEWLARRGRETARRQQVLALAEAGSAEHTIEIDKAEAEALASFTFSCKRQGEFIVVHWSEKGEPLSRAVNLSFVSHIDFSPGRARSDTGGVIFNEYRWQYSDASPWYTDIGNYWNGYENGTFAQPSICAEIRFKGVDVTMRVPHVKGADVHEALLTEIARGA